MAAARRTGVPPHVPTKETRAIVKSNSAFGIQPELIAEQLGISAKTLLRHYRHETVVGVADAVAKVAQRLYAKATAKKMDQAGVTAAIFFLKARSGTAGAPWRDDFKTIDTISSDGSLKNGASGVVVLIPDNGRNAHLLPATRPAKALSAPVKQIEAEAVEVE